LFATCEDEVLASDDLIAAPAPASESPFIIPIENPSKIPQSSAKTKFEQDLKASEENLQLMNKGDDNSLPTNTEPVNEAPNNDEESLIANSNEIVGISTPVPEVDNADLVPNEESHPSTTAIPVTSIEQPEANKEDEPVPSPISEPVNPLPLPSPQETAEIIGNLANDAKNSNQPDVIAPVSRPKRFQNFILVILLVCLVLILGLSCHYRYQLEKYRIAPFTPPSFCPNFLFPKIESDRRGFVSDTYQSIEVGNYYPPEMRHR